MADKTRPGGIIFVSVLNFLFALLMIVSVIFVIMLANEFSNNSSANFGGYGWFLIIILSINSILFIVGGIGLSLGKKWGKIISIMAWIILTISSIYDIMSFESFHILLIIIIISLIIIVYLFINKKVRDYISN
ncbi:MAG: hypothetical protein AABW82_04860 [Nanoarchaeota archaeon]